MNKESNTQFNNEQWYALWMKQSQDFLESAEANLKKIFNDKNFAHPEQYRQQIEAWLETLKQHWQIMQFNENQKQLQEQWQSMMKMCNEATDLMWKEWLKRSAEQPIANVNELYQLWLKCCGDVYKQNLDKQNLKNSYNAFVTATMDFWKQVLPK